MILDLYKTCATLLRGIIVDCMPPIPSPPCYQIRSVLSFHNCVKTDVTSDEDYYNFRLNEIKRLGIAGNTNKNTNTNTNKNLCVSKLLNSLKKYLLGFVTETNNNGHDVFPLLDRIGEQSSLHSN